MRSPANAEAATSADEAAMEEVPLMAGAPTSSDSAAAAPSEGIPSNSEQEEGTCRICLETSPFAELQEPCACKGTLQRVHPACLQRWIDERELAAGVNPLVCEICKQPYVGAYRAPAPRPGASRPRGERVRVGQELYMIVVDPQTGMATARPVGGVGDMLGAEEEEEGLYPDRLNPVSACAASFFLFVMCSLLLSHLFTSLPGPEAAGGGSGGSGGGGGGGSSSGGGSMPPMPMPMPMDQDTADEQFQDVSATLLLLWLLLRLLVLVAPVYSISRFLERAQMARALRVAEARGRNLGAAREEGVEMNAVGGAGGRAPPAPPPPTATQV